MPGKACLLQAVLFTALLCAAAWIDFRKRVIPDFLSLGIAVTALFCFRPVNVFGAAAAIPFLVEAVKGGMGGGDVKLVAACGLVLGFSDALAGCAFGLVLMLCFCLFFMGGWRRGKACPMAPFLSAGFLVAYFCV